LMTPAMVRQMDSPSCCWIFGKISDKNQIIESPLGLASKWMAPTKSSPVRFSKLWRVGADFHGVPDNVNVPYSAFGKYRALPR
jgi:hypothetical protein